MTNCSFAKCWAGEVTAAMTGSGARLVYGGGDAGKSQDEQDLRA